MDTVAKNIKKMRNQLLNQGIKAAAAIGFITLMGSLSRIWISGWHPLMFLHIALYLIILGLAIYGRYFSFSLRAYVVAGVTLVLGIGLLVGGGFASFGILSLFCFCIISTILFGTRAGVISCVISIGIIGAIGACVYSGIISYKPSLFLELNSPVLWITAIFAVALSAGIIVVILGALNRQFERLALTLQEQNEEIVEKNRLLEKEIVEKDRIEKERIILEDKLRLAQKMEAIGKLAGGVAHDLNNALGSVVAYSDLLVMDLPASSTMRSPLEKIRKTGLKAATIVNDMLTLAQSGISKDEVFDINTVINEYFKSTEFDQLISFHQDVLIEIRSGKESLKVRGSFTHLSRVLMNLISNAAEATPNGGRIIISTERRRIGKEGMPDENIQPGEYVLLCVSDTGIGIPKEDLEKIFEPFYTKKKMGRSGTGLGMSVVWSSVKAHNGHIKVESTEGTGTKYQIYLPLTEDEETTSKYPYSQKEIRGQGETVLVVDDVAEQREITVALLERMGYSVHAIGSGEEAIEFIRRNSVDLLILDMIMDPGIDGLETYKKILRIRPKQKTIITSGYSETSRVKKALSLGAGAYMKKPFLYNQIGYLVRTELDKRTKDINRDSGP